MNRLSIAVAMCTCNGSRYVREQLQSIARQTTAADELVVCDDGSTDQTAPMVEEFAAGSPIRLRLARNPIALGCTRNFEQAIRLCSSQIIVLADQDDIWKPNKLAAIARAFADQPGAGYVFSDADIVDERGSGLEFSLWETVGFKAPQFSPSRQVAMLLKRNLVTGAAMAFRASSAASCFPSRRLGTTITGSRYWARSSAMAFPYQNGCSSTGATSASRWDAAKIRFCKG